MRKILCFLVLALFMSVMASANGTKVGDLYYLFDGSNATVTYTCAEKPSASGQNEYTGDIVIPATINYDGTDYTITKIGEGAFFRSTITSVVIPEGVTFIGKEAFAHTSISSIEFPNSVNTIEGDACAYCNSLKVVTIGENVQSFSQGLCYGTSVADVYSNITGTVHSQVSYMFPDNTRIHVAADRVNDYTSKWTSYYIVSDYNGVYYSIRGSNATVTYPGIYGERTADKTAVYSGDIVIPSTIDFSGTTYTVTAIGNNAFSHSAITSLEIPNSVTVIEGDAAAYINATLATVTIGSGVTSVSQGFCWGTTPTNVYIKTKSVPAGAPYMFSGFPTLHVYDFMIDAFREANFWKDYTFADDLPGDYAALQAKAAEAQGYALLVGNNPGQFTPASYAAVENALASYAALDAASPASAINASLLEFSNAIDALLASTPNPITEGYYFIVCDNANIAANGKPEKALYANKDLMQLYWGELETADLKYVFRFTDNGDGTWNLQNMDNGLYAGAATGFCVETSVTETADYPVTFYFDGEGSYRIKANNWTYCPHGNPEGNQDGPSYVWGYNAEGIHGEASYTLRAIDAATMNSIIGSMITDMDEITTSDDPGRYTATSVAAYNTALNTAKEAVTAGTADMTTYEGLLAAKNQLVTNPITEGYYFIVCDNAYIAANGKPEKALYANKDLMQLYWGELETADLKYVFRFTDNGDGTWNLQNMDNGLYAGAATGFCVETSVTETADYPVTFYFDGEGSYRIKANNWTYCPHGNPEGNQDGPSYVWGYNAEGIHGEASYTLRAIDAATMNSIIGSMITDMDEITTSDDPGRYTATSVAAYNTALNTAKEAVTAGTADMTTYEGLLAAKNQLVTNPITEGYYFIASAGNGPGYSGGPYEYEDDDAMYNADGIVKWKAYDSTDASQLYYLTQKEGNSWYVYNVMDATYIDNGGTGNSSTVRTSTDKVNGQEFHPMVAGTGKFAIKSPSYCYGLAANHNGSPNAEGNLCVWGTVNDCYSFGVNVWYLHKISNADAEQMIADAVANTNSVVAMPTNETGNHTNVIVDGVCSDLVLTDGLPFSAPSDFTATTATYTRAMSNEWGTICLPYEVSGDATTKYYTISAIENNSLVVSEVATLTAGTPALVQKLSGDAITATAANVPVSATIAAPSGTVEMYGVYERTKVEDPNAYYIKDNKFWQCNNYFFCGAFRAYFTTSGAGSNSFSIIVDNDDPTAIAGVEAGNDAAVAIYSTDGTRLGTLRSGINIVKQADGKTLKIQVK